MPLAEATAHVHGDFLGLGHKVIEEQRVAVDEEDEASSHEEGVERVDGVPREQKHASADDEREQHHAEQDGDERQLESQNGERLGREGGVGNRGMRAREEHR